MFSHKRRIAEDIVNLLGGDDLVPVHLQGIAAHDGWGVDKRQPAEVLAEFLGHLHVHLVVREPKRDLGYLGGEFLELDAVELVNVHLHKLENIKMALVLLADSA